MYIGFHNYLYLLNVYIKKLYFFFFLLFNRFILFNYLYNMGF